MVIYEMINLQFQVVYNTLSFSLASMMATTVYTMGTPRRAAFWISIQRCLLVLGLALDRANVVARDPFGHGP